jgi:hypothetical protein
MSLLNVNMVCVNKELQEIPATPPLIFRLQYIDKDKGWSDIGKSFNNLAYIKDWKSNSNKYIEFTI